MELGVGFRAFYNVYRISVYFLTVCMVDNRLGTLIHQALERLLTDIWVRDLFRTCRMLKLNSSSDPGAVSRGETK